MSTLVSPEWLAECLHEPDTVVLDATLPPVGVTPPVDTRARYREQHIPGAVFFDIDEISDQETALPHMLPKAEAFARSMGELGVSRDARIIVYEQAGVFSAPRARWMLRAFGAKDVSLLDGGLRAWTEAGLPTESGIVHRPATEFQAALDERAVVDLRRLQMLLAQNAQILDARSSGRFNGTVAEPRPGLCSGHMPGATNLPFTELLRDGRIKPVSELFEIFTNCGIDLDQPIVASCGSGVTAAVLLLGLELLSAPQTRLYDGSWSEYASQPDAVIAFGPSL